MLDGKGLDMTPTKSWKKFELWVCRQFGLERRGAHTSKGGKGSGKNDCIGNGWSIEVKLLGRPSWGDINAAISQAEDSAENALDIPIAVIKKNGKGLKNNDAVVAMRFETFIDFFGGSDGNL
jgi:hypothetical protein